MDLKRIAISVLANASVAYGLLLISPEACRAYVTATALYYAILIYRRIRDKVNL